MNLFESKSSRYFSKDERLCPTCLKNKRERKLCVKLIDNGFNYYCKCGYSISLSHHEDYLLDGWIFVGYVSDGIMGYCRTEKYRDEKEEIIYFITDNNGVRIGDYTYVSMDMINMLEIMKKEILKKNWTE